MALPNSTQTIDAIRQACMARPDLLASAVLGYTITPFHSRMLYHQHSRKTSMVLAPRGGGKSLILDVTRCLNTMLKYPNIRICIASKTGPQAQGFLELIKSHMTENEDFIKLFGELQGPTWTKDEIIIKTRTKIQKEPTITALGAGEGIVGKHFDLIIGDDLVDLENSKTQYQRDALEQWFFNVVDPTLEPDGEFHIIGTRYHEDDLYGRFAKRDRRTGEYKNTVFGPNLLVIPALTPVLDAEGHVILDPATNLPQEQSFWPDYFTVEYLQEKRRVAGLRNFNLQYQNDATIVDGSIMNIEDLEPYVWPTYVPKPDDDELAIFIGVDPAISQKQEADFFAIAVIGVNPKDGHVFVLEVHKDKMSFRDQVAKLLELNEKWRPIRIGAEAVAYQSALAGELLEHPFVPVEPLQTRQDKVLRANAFSAWVSQHKIHCHYTHFELMETLAGMPNVEHDDLFDALEFAVQVARDVVISGATQVLGRLPSNMLGRR